MNGKNKTKIHGESSFFIIIIILLFFFPCLQAVYDMTLLDKVDEASVLHNLTSLLDKGQIYCYIGNGKLVG